MVKTKHLDDIANKYHETKDPKYKDLWYKGIKELAKSYGYYNSKRRALPFDPNNEQNVNGISVSRKR